jgi:ABC-type proline/glycine betaine transport system substrate-binding protein
MEKNKLVNAEIVSLIVDLAMEVGKEDDIDFGMLEIDEESAYTLMASNVLEKYSSIKNNELVMLGTITHLLVHNFILNVKINSLK